MILPQFSPDELALVVAACRSGRLLTFTLAELKQLSCGGRGVVVMGLAKGDSAFNESFATAVENEGMNRWLASVAQPELRAEQEKQQMRKEQFYRLVAQTREQLRAVYASSLTRAEKLGTKAEVYAQMLRTYAELKAGWGGYGGYDGWFSQPLNNAVLGSVTLYAQWVPAFQALLEQEGGDLPHFYQCAKLLANMPKVLRTEVLEGLLSGRKDAS